jgi:hypothetical protein
MAQAFTFIEGLPLLVVELHSRSGDGGGAD